MKKYGMTLIEILVLGAIIICIVSIIIPNLGDFWRWIQSTLFD